MKCFTHLWYIFFSSVVAYNSYYLLSDQAAIHYIVGTTLQCCAVQCIIGQIYSVTIDYSLTLRRLSKSRRLAWHQNAGLWITERSRYPPDALKAQRALSARRKHVHVFGNPGILIILCHLPLWERFSHHKRSSNIGGDYEKSTIRRLFQIYSERHNTATLAALYTSRRGGSLLH